MSATSVFGVRCLFLWTWNDVQTYEESITLWTAASMEEAVELAEAAARDYETDRITYLGFAQAYRTDIESIAEMGEGAEVFSLLRDSELDPSDYLDAFFDTGREHQGTIPTD